MKTILFTTIGAFVSKIVYKWDNISSREFIQVHLLDEKIIWLNTSYVIYVQEMDDVEFKKFQPLLNRKIEIPNTKGGLN